MHQQGARLRQLSEHYFDALLDADPLMASWLGLDTPARAGRLTISIAPAHLTRLHALHQHTLKRLRALPVHALADADRLHRDVLEHSARDALDALAFPEHLLPLDQSGYSPPFSLAGAADNGLCAFATPAHYAQHLARLRSLPAWCRQAESNLREGIRRAVVLPTALAERLLPMLKGLCVDDLAASPYTAPLRQLPAQWPAAQRAAIERDYGAVVAHKVLPAVQQLTRMVERDYLPHTRTSAGLGSLPGGAAWYRCRVRSATTTELTPEAIHPLGLAEVARLDDELRRLQAGFGHVGSLQDFLAWHEARPEAHPFHTEAEVLDAYRALQQRITTGLPALFGRLPAAQLMVQPEPELTRDTASDHYLPPSGDGSRPGVFYAVIREPRQQSVTRMATLFMHEGLPGHHLQISLAQAMPLPRLQRHFGSDGYVEGWAHYAETLGHALGIYDDPSARLGHVLDSMLRAVRLVVDTGLHLHGWSREQAIDTLRRHTGISETEARVQIERYMAWPGQALAYAIGRRTIETLRDQARAALGQRFSLAAFHDEVLGTGALPLILLQTRIQRWVTQQPA